MAHQPNPNDPFHSPLTDDDIRRQARLDNELQADPELAEGPASSGRIAMLAVAIAVILGVVFYGLNNTPIHQAATSTAQNTAQTPPPGAPPGMRDVTPPRANTEPGTTAGAAPANPRASTDPKAAPIPSPSGSTK
jgi:hypothetical protein